MDLKISDKTLKDTIKCKKGFSCLSGDQKGLCQVTLHPYKTLYFIECRNNEEECIYQTPIDNAYICACPTRKEIYDRYGI